MATSPFVPEEERAEYVRPAFLQKVAQLEPIDWLPKIQAKKFRLQEQIFEPSTPKAAKKKLRVAVPAIGTIAIYKSPKDMDKVVSESKELEWIKHELHSLPSIAHSSRCELHSAQ